MIDIGEFVPLAHARFRNVIAEAFDYFIACLPAGRRPIARAGRPTTRSAGLHDLIQFAFESPTLHKLGQVLARRRGLPADVRTALQSLESSAPSQEPAAIRRIILTELGPKAAELRIADHAIAEASVAVIVPFSWNPQPGIRREGVFKVQKPGIRRRLDEELAVWGQLADHFSDRCRANGLPEFNYREAFDTAAELLRHEIDFTGEQANIACAAEQLQAVPGVKVPRLLPFCTSNLTAMERMHGRKLTDAGEFQAEPLADRLVDALIVQPIVSPAPLATFHADPHAGNLMLTTGGDLVLIDWALAGRLSTPQREQLAQIALGAALRDRGMIARALHHLAEGPIDHAKLVDCIDRALRDLRGSLFPALGWLEGLMDTAVLDACCRFSHDLLLFRKSLLMLDGVVRDLAGEGRLDLTLRSCAIRQLACEWPVRPFLPPSSRSLGSRLSNLDLAAAAWLFPLAGLRSV